MDDTFNPAALTRSDTITSTATTKAPQVPASKTTKTTQNYPRIDLEPLYTELKLLIGHNWETYFDAITRFIRGELNQREFGDLCDVFIYATPQTEHAHNSLVLAILFNSSRDAPEPGVANWVSATTDKTAAATTTKATVTSDASEQRLKAEVMSLPARDRRRLKAIATDKAEEEAAARRNPYEEYFQAGRIKAPEVSVPAGGAAAGLTKTNWDMEIRKRYVQSLFAETLEFPDTTILHTRMMPICYEESISQGCSMHSAELVGIAAETFLKSLVSEIVNRTRSNGPVYEHSAGGGIHTNRYKKRLTMEELEFRAGKIQRTREDDFLPVEAEAAYARRALGIADFQLSARTGPVPWNGFPLIGFNIANASAGYDHDQWLVDQEAASNVNGDVVMTNGHVEDDDVMDADGDGDNYGWEGANERVGLQSLLGECLAIPA
jgi:hypothetical protein